MLTLLFLSLSLGGLKALTEDHLNALEGETNKLIRDRKVEATEKYKALSMLAFELQGYGFRDKAIQAYEKALDLRTSTSDPLEVATNLLALNFQKNLNKAEELFFNKVKALMKTSTKEAKGEVLKFWTWVFSKKVDTKNYHGLYGQFFKDQDTKKLMRKRKFKEALSLLTPEGLEERSINVKLEYDVLSFLNGKRNGFFCESTLKKYPDSYDVLVDTCRYLKSQPLKNENFKSLIRIVQQDLPHLNYLYEALNYAKEGK